MMKDWVKGFFFLKMTNFKKIRDIDVHPPKIFFQILAKVIMLKAKIKLHSEKKQ